MAQTLEEKLLYAIEKDDLKAFEALMDVNPLGNYRLGRFPVLSALYLFNCRKIIKRYEDRLIKNPSWEPLGEPMAIAERFRKRAGKCLRLYFNEVVSPLEMLLILDKTKRVAQNYPLARPSEAVRSRLKTIYFIKYALTISYSGRSIDIPRRPLKRREMGRIALVAAAVMLLVAIIVATPITVKSFLPDLAKGEVTKLSHIDFSQRRTYTLKRDIVIPDDFVVEDVNCNIDGGGKRLILGKNVSLGRLRSKISNVIIETQGSPIFTVCTNLAELSDVTVNVNCDVTISQSSSFVTLSNYGSIEGVTVNVGGTLTAVVDPELDPEGDDDIIFGGIASTNTYTVDSRAQYYYGVIKNCAVHYDDFRLQGIQANASFGGIAGINTGIVQDSVVSGSVTADAFDLAGACYLNGNRLDGIVNDCNLSQTSDRDGWTPIVGGIAIENASRIENCVNNGSLGATGRNEAIVGGIVGRSYGMCEYCMTTGDISVKAASAYVGGIFGMGLVVTQQLYVYLGAADKCISECDIKVEVGDTSYVGGICGYLQEALLGGDYWGGGVTNSIFLGSHEGDFDYFGSIVGVTGSHIYEQNAYPTSSEEMNFLGNYYASDKPCAFGAGATLVEDSDDIAYAPLPDKGATLSSASDITSSALYLEIIARLSPPQN